MSRKMLLGTCALITLSLAILLYSSDPDRHFVRSCLVYTAAFAPYLFLAFQLDSVRVQALSRSLLYVLCGVPFLTLMWAPPSLSDDVYRYLWEGHAWWQGINPYSTPPADVLGDDPYRQMVNHAGLTAVYPPLLQLVAACVMALNYSLLAWKSLLVVVFACGCWATTQLLRSRDQSPERVLLFAWNPLLLVEISGMGHLDLIPAVAILLALLSWRGKRDGWMNVALATGTCCKVFPFLLVPLFIRGVTPKSRLYHGISLVLGVAVLALVTLMLLQALAPFDSPLDIFRSLSRYAQTWEFNSPLYYSALSMGAAKWMVRASLASFTAVALLSCAFVLKPHEDRSYVCGWLIALILVCSPVIHPWYVVALVIFIPLVPLLSVLYLSWGVFLAYSILPHFRAHDVWSESTGTLTMIWVPYFVLVVYDLLRREYLKKR